RDSPETAVGNNPTAPTNHAQHAPQPTHVCEHTQATTPIRLPTDPLRAPAGLDRNP
ncbi:hypothetical protein THAOC_04851, partial [Thalassiosira oceanica]